MWQLLLCRPLAGPRESSPGTAHTLEAECASFRPVFLGPSPLHTTSGLLHGKPVSKPPVPLPTPAPQLLGPTKTACVRASGAERADSPHLPCATQHKGPSVHPAWRARCLPSSARHWDPATGVSQGGSLQSLRRARWPKRQSHTQVKRIRWPRAFGKKQPVPLRSRSPPPGSVLMATESFYRAVP